MLNISSSSFLTSSKGTSTKKSKGVASSISSKSKKANSESESTQEKLVGSYTDVHRINNTDTYTNQEKKELKEQHGQHNQTETRIENRKLLVLAFLLVLFHLFLLSFNARCSVNLYTTRAAVWL